MDDYGFTFNTYTEFSKDLILAAVDAFRLYKTTGYNIITQIEPIDHYEPRVFYVDTYRIDSKFIRPNGAIAFPFINWHLSDFDAKKERKSLLKMIEYFMSVIGCKDIRKETLDKEFTFDAKWFIAKNDHQLDRNKKIKEKKVKFKGREILLLKQYIAHSDQTEKLQKVFGMQTWKKVIGYPMNMFGEQAIITLKEELEKQDAEEKNEIQKLVQAQEDEIQIIKKKYKLQKEAVHELYFKKKDEIVKQLKGYAQ